jgi:hypothetical protein
MNRRHAPSRDRLCLADERPIDLLTRFQKSLLQSIAHSSPHNFPNQTGAKSHVGQLHPLGRWDLFIGKTLAAILYGLRVGRIMPKRADSVVMNFAVRRILLPSSEFRERPAWKREPWKHLSPGHS